MKDVPVEEAGAYAAADAAIVLRLIPQLQKELEAAQAITLMQELELPLIEVLADMEMAGIGLDMPYLARMSTELNTRMAELEQHVFEAVGESFNMNSTQQLSHALFDRLKLIPPGGTRRTTSGF